MKFEFFEELSTVEAEAFLHQFLTEESANIGALLAEAARQGIVGDFSLPSIAPLMRWVAPKIVSVPKSPDVYLPDWLRNTEVYSKGLFEFDEQSEFLTLRAAYYFGESFVRGCRGLRWNVGDTDTAEVNMPVVSGFKGGLEMAPILVTENLFRRLVSEPSRLYDIDTAITYWAERA